MLVKKPTLRGTSIPIPAAIRCDTLTRSGGYRLLGSFPAAATLARIKAPQPPCPGVPMLLSLVYFALRQLLRLLTVGGDVIMLLATLSCWSCAISSVCSPEVVAHGFSVGTGSCLRRRQGYCHATGGDASPSPRRPCSVGTVNS